ncbi:MAG: SDR family NAD(P)-dependent oxidoreductase [Thermoplasmatota archaeon]
MHIHPGTAWTALGDKINRGSVHSVHMLLRDRKIFITGGSRGIGAAAVKGCSAEGAVVGFTYNSSGDRARALADEIGSACETYKADTSDPEAVGEALARFHEFRREGIDGLVINAGIYRRSSFHDLDYDSWRRTMEVNLDGAFHTIRKAVELMDAGSIVIISSQLAFKGSSSGSDYASSKAGLLGLSRSLARELAPDIRVNAIAPGYIDTDILAGDSQDKRRKRIRDVPLGRIGDPKDISDSVVFLLSDMSSYITGATLDVNGGLFIH